MKNEGVEYLGRVDIVWKYYCGLFFIWEIKKDYWVMQEFN